MRHPASTRIMHLAAAACLVLGAMAIAPAHGQTAADYPSAPIRIVVPSASGGLSDPWVRFVGDRLRAAWGQPVVMEHRAGGGGIIGGQYVVNAPPDGHTLLIGNAGGQLFTPLLNPKTPYVVQRDLVPIGTPFTFANVLIVHPSVKANTVRELIQLAKEKPGTLQFASSGIGQSHHLSGELFKRMAGIDIAHVPYKGSGPAATDLVGGHVPMMFANIPAALPFIQAGKARALAVTGARRSVALPDVPTMDEAGVPGYMVVSWIGLFAPAATPAPVLAKLTDEVNRAWESPEGQRLLQSLNIDWTKGTGESFRAFLNTENAKWTPVIRDANITAE
jgi:tripartite-type tricarboxylate transporter receptor subunit TctC